MSVVESSWIKSFFFAPMSKGGAFNALWKTEKEDTAEILDGAHILWNCNGKLSKIDIDKANEKLTYVVKETGEVLTATISKDNRELKWSDSETWVKHRIMEVPTRGPLLLVGFFSLITVGITQFCIATWLQEEFEDDEGAFAIWWGLYNGVPLFLSFFVNPMWGDWSDHVGRKTAYMCAMFVLLGYPLGMVLTPSKTGIVISSIFSGLGNCWLMLIITMFTDFCRYQEEIAKNFGKALIVIALGALVAVVLVSIIIQSADPDWRALFFIGVISLSLSIAYVWKCVPETHHALWTQFHGISYHKNAVAKEDDNEFKKGTPVDRDATRNPFALMAGLRQEHFRIQGYAIVRCTNAFLFYAFQASILAVCDEIYGWSTHDMIPLIIQTICLIIASNAMVPMLERWKTKEELLMIGVILNLLETLVRCFCEIHWVVLVLARMLLLGPAMAVPAIISGLISEVCPPDRYGRVIGSVDAFSNLAQTLSWILPVLIFAWFQSDGMPDLPTAPFMFEFLVNIFLLCWVYYLLNYTEKPVLTTASRKSAIAVMIDDENGGGQITDTLDNIKYSQ